MFIYICILRTFPRHVFIHSKIPMAGAERICKFIFWCIIKLYFVYSSYLFMVHCILLYTCFVNFSLLSRQIQTLLFKIFFLVGFVTICLIFFQINIMYAIIDVCHHTSRLYKIVIPRILHVLSNNIIEHRFTKQSIIWGQIQLIHCWYMVLYVCAPVYLCILSLFLHCMYNLFLTVSCCNITIVMKHMLLR